MYVLAVGIDAYNSDQFSRLKFAGKDARAFGTAVQQAAIGLYEEAYVTYAIDQAATVAALDEAVERTGRQIHPRDTFILFVSAHGYSRNWRFYLIPQDYPDGLEAIATHAIGQGTLQGWIANHIKARKVLILLDTCESGALVAGHTISRISTINAPASKPPSAACMRQQAARFSLPQLPGVPHSKATMIMAFHLGPPRRAEKRRQGSEWHYRGLGAGRSRAGDGGHDWSRAQFANPRICCDVREEHVTDKPRNLVHAARILRSCAGCSKANRFPPCALVGQRDPSTKTPAL